jgi:putative endonuclease
MLRLIKVILHMIEHWVYILLCTDKSYYTGKTSNLEKRFNEHQYGIYKGYTYLRRPVELVYSQKFYDVKEAIEAERKIKGWSRKKKEALIRGNFELLHELAVCKNESHYNNK